MKKQLIYIHGGNAYSNYDAFLDDLRTKPLRELPDAEPRNRWTDHLARDLGDDYEVFAPKMPNTQNAKYLEWKIWFERYLALVRDGVLLLGWSQGGYFLSKYLTEEVLPVRPAALFLLAAPFAPDNFGGEDGGDFVFDTTKLEELSKKVDTIYLLHSKDDPVVPFWHAESYAQALPEANMVAFDDKNHFLIAEFPELLDRIKAL